MADIVTNTLQIGSNNLILQDAGARQNIATNTQDISDLKDGFNGLKEDFTQSQVEDFPLVKEKLEHVVSDNLFDKSKAIVGRLDTDGSITPIESHKTSDFIKVESGDTLKFWYVVNATVYAANMSRVNTYNSSKEFLANIIVNTQTFEVPTNTEYIRFCASNGVVDTGMLINGFDKPSKYIEYYDYYVASEAFINDALQTKGVAILPIAKKNTDFWEEEKSVNLYNVEDAVPGEYFNTNGTTQQNSNVARAFVHLDGAGTYMLKVDGAFFGLQNALKIPCFDAEKAFVKTISGTTTDSTATIENLCSLTVSDADIASGVAYIGFSMASTIYTTLMVVKGSTYPADYIPYYHYWCVPDAENLVKNHLLGKQIVFDGDSICAGLGSAMGDYGNGYAGRIAVDYSTNAVNVAVSGACITAETYFSGGSPRHWISRYIDTIHSNYPDADYIIAEGGTNDADNFYGDTSKLGTFDETDFTGPFDDTTFYGAMDSWCKKALTYFPKTKIGFIVAQKMGTGFATYVKNRYDYFTYASKVCKKWGIPVLNLWDDGQLRPDVTSMYDPTYNTIETATEHGLPYYDAQHLTAYGYDVISSKIGEWLLTL